MGGSWVGGTGTCTSIIEDTSCNIVADIPSEVGGVVRGGSPGPVQVGGEDRGGRLSRHRPVDNSAELDEGSRGVRGPDIMLMVSQASTRCKVGETTQLVTLCQPSPPLDLICLAR